ncbi:Tat (twin-arginine translocation) pathway signal sequence [Onishia taeanensis]|uniref:Tat (Twin-arginine translocation) pathway signal sequence n=1 Tax=Onishia taeanensis TaxID=284577 RepID=A0A1G7PEP9_9GAMM|nr:high-potential iron-sulfur protein [Halomonas taeanensis]MAX31441.1 high potential iron-sulfur protein [Halomonadaceae bacterium]SDF84721.1 Tat (twin-arginine translocation) pathway signal sequence [Halomonas taeanensis]|tara:strand:- start:26215 stop:26526 length:312 start_codon:yes stop_codon:yes gene_type:complete
MANQSRRDFMRNSLLGLAALPLGAGILSRQALAQDLPPLDPENPQAKALNYVTQASDASDHPAYADGEKCSNCMFYNADTQGCQLFPQNSVAAGGWCQSWTAA